VRLSRLLIGVFWDRLAINVSEISPSIYQVLLRRGNSAKSESFQAILVGP